LNVLKAVVASAINGNSELLFARNWNDEFIDAPLIGEQNKPSTTWATTHRFESGLSY